MAVRTKKTFGAASIRSSRSSTPMSIINESFAEHDARRERLSDVCSVSIRSNDKSILQNMENINVLSDQRESFLSNIKLFQNNKITKQNIWQVNLIHDFYCLVVDMKDEIVIGNLQLASIGLDASTKIYAMRVDDVHRDVVRLAFGLRQAETKAINLRKEIQDDENIAMDDNDHTQKKKKSKKPKSRSHIVTDLNIINREKKVDAELDRLFMCRNAMLSEKMTTDNLYSLTLNIYKGSLVTNICDIKLIRIEDHKEPNINNNEYPKGKLIKWIGTKINQSLANFKFLDRASEQESIFNKEAVYMNSSQQEIAFDITAFVDPIPPESNSSLFCDDQENNEFPNSGAENGKMKIGEEGMRYKEDAYGQSQNHKVLYSFNPRTKRLISNLYAGPRHLNFPFQSNAKQSSEARSISGKSHARNVKRSIPHQNLWNSEEIDDNLFKSKRMNRHKNTIMLTWNPSKVLLPEDLKLLFEEQNRCFIRVSQSLNTKTMDDISKVTSIDDSIPKYNYKSVNDSNFCAIVNNDDLYSDDDNHDPNEMNSNGLVYTQELVDTPPHLVNKVKINYDTKVRTVDMKLIKRCTWDIIQTHLILPAPGIEKKSYIMFSDVFAELHRNLPHFKKENVTLAVAALSVMHITNDRNLHLTQVDNKDFKISLAAE